MASPITNQLQQGGVPYDPKRDCSQGFCSIYCPQWCYIIFPPPPPFAFDDEDGDSSSGGPTFSPLVIAIIGILASAFLLVSYYTIISKYCGGFSRNRNNRPRRPSRRDPSASVGPAADDDDDDAHDRPQAWHDSPSSNGLDEALISKITMCKYKRGDGLVDCTDCSVCLSEFREDETLRLLPKCSHAFHVQCIDTWLRSHSNCPLCRANIVTASPSQTVQLPEISRPDGESGDEVAIVVHDLVEVVELEHDGDESKEASEGHTVEIVEDDVVQPIRRSVSLGSPSHRGRVSIADILQVSMEDEYMMAKDRGILVDGGSSSRERGENSKGSERSRKLHAVMSPVQMKRSVSSGRFGIARQGRGRNSVIPIIANS